ncbi:hypothetical protein AVEN_220705-1 [Araneus ventricosus]|uniref:Tc1-like transposase DDE domain-containing protein n=1 Tax=Araneus ventricosus TaxID=182803 RepID=A0A4Y2L360_ARAVE|nr:hypothetical protein AVEN_97272-1 [Araneus ventricosus]GBN08967.1 hypothetical protein AVEN_100497-1 [Araneus ventricosus]GBN09031.1 hypothetical protein AVEN_212811-1 [Araneus ventricosus]GBN09040.1 hypothetical protein AVEN_220705-1 [Araneus ventricosus]
MVCVSLTVDHCVARRRWAQEHLIWRRDEWRDVLFTDESRFSIRLSSGENVTLGIILHLRTKVSDLADMDWAGVSINGRTDLYIIRNGELTAQRCRDDILRPIVGPYAASIWVESILMDDNARPHCARLVDNFLFNEGILRMDWPAYSSDINPIEHVWDILGRRIADRSSLPETIQQLESSLLQEWERIPKSFIDNLIIFHAS